MNSFIFLIVIIVIVRGDGVYSQSGPSASSASAGLSPGPQQLQTQAIYPTDSVGQQYHGSSSYPSYSSSQSGQYAGHNVAVPSSYSSQNGNYAVAEEKFPEIIEDAQDVQPYSNSQILENAAYDPDLYQNFVPQDAVQQYISQYGGPFPPASSAIGYPLPYGAPGFPNPAAFGVQTGYEGFLVPAVPPPPPPPIGLFDLFSSMLPYPRTVSSMFMRSGSWLVSALTAVLFGGAITTAICTMTPLCTITFAALPLLGLRDTAQKLTAKIGSEVTSARMARAADFVRNAIEKYQQIQDERIHKDIEMVANKTTKADSN